MKVQNVITVVLALLVVFWLGGWALHLFSRLVRLAMQFAILALAAAVIVTLVTSRKH